MGNLIEINEKEALLAVVIMKLQFYGNINLEQ